jgi:hypothetical protein
MQIIQSLTARVAHLENEIAVLRESQHMHQITSSMSADSGDGRGWGI